MPYAPWWEKVNIWVNMWVNMGKSMKTCPAFSLQQLCVILMNVLVLTPTPCCLSQCVWWRSQWTHTVFPAELTGQPWEELCPDVGTGLVTVALATRSSKYGMAPKRLQLLVLQIFFANFHHTWPLSVIVRAKPTDKVDHSDRICSKLQCCLACSK